MPGTPSCRMPIAATSASSSSDVLLIAVGAGGQEALDRVSRAPWRRWCRGSVAVVTDEDDVDFAEDGPCCCWVWGTVVEAGGEAVEHPASLLVRQARERLVAPLEARGAWIIVLSTSAGTRIAHDHLGARGLVHAPVPGGQLIAEHIADLLLALPRTPGPDAITVASWLERAQQPLGRSFYDTVRRLPPGRLLNVDGTGAHEAAHWSPRFRQPSSGTPDDLASRLRGAIDGAVRRSVASSAAPAVQLSGGLDSSTVAGALVQIHGGFARAYTATFAGRPEADEIAVTRATAGVLGLELHEVLPTSSDAITVTAEEIARWRLPPATPMGYMLRRLRSAALAAGVDLLLDGEGGDELFRAQPGYLADLIRHGRLASAWRAAGRLPGMGPHPSRAQRLRVLRANALGPALPSWARRSQRPTHGDGLLVASGDLDRVRELPEPELPDGPRWWRDLVWSAMYEGDLFDANGHLSREGAAAGLRLGHPFLHDGGLLDTVLSLPPAAAFDGVVDRALLRRSMAGRLPRAQLERTRKAHFTELLLESVRGEHGRSLVARLSAPGAPVREFVPAPNLQRLVRGVEQHELADEITLLRVGAVDAWLASL